MRMAYAVGKRTAEIVALARADGCNDPAVRNPDFLAHRLLRPTDRLLLLPGLRRLVRASFERRVPGMYMYHQARTKYLDRLLLSRLDGVSQVVILGAGLDTRPYRFESQLRGKGVFEVDHPGTAAWKRRRLRRLGRATDHVSYVAVDFNRDGLDACLAQAGFRADRTAFFLWEGVVMYLPPASVEATLAVLGRCAPGSEVAFDYVFRGSLERPGEFPGALGYQRYVAGRGEPCRSGFDPEEVAPMLRRFGFEAVSNVGPAELSVLTAPHPLCAYFGIAHGRIADGSGVGP